MVERALANAVAQAVAAMSGNGATSNVLDWRRHPGSRTDLTAEDRGREAEVRNLARAREETARVRFLRRRRLAVEMTALVEELGLHSDDEAGRQRQAVSAVGHVAEFVAPSGSPRQLWALPPDGYPAWRAFTLHFAAEVLPGLGAATVIALTGAPLVAAGVAVMGVGTAVSGTIIKRWYGRRDKALVDGGHGVAGKQRAYAAALRRKQLLDPLLARMRTSGVAFGPERAEPAPLDSYPAKYQSYGARLVQRGVPMLIGASAASLLMFAGLPFWNAATHFAVAGLAAAGGPIVERYLRSSVVSREWALLDNVGRAMDETAADFDARFVAGLHAVADRLDALAGVPSPQVTPTQDAVVAQQIDEVGLHRFAAEQSVGQLGNLARGVTDGQGKLADGKPGAAEAALNAYYVGGFRTVLGTLINSFLDRRFLNAEYREIVTQVEFDFGARMAEQVALEHRTLRDMLTELNQRIDVAEASLNRVAASASGRVAFLNPPTPGDPADRPRGHQRWQAFLRLQSLQATSMAGLMVGANYLFDQDGIGMLVVGGAAAVLTSTFALRYLFRRSEQLAVDETIFADRAKERVVETAEAAARRQFFTKLWIRELAAVTESPKQPPTGPPPRPDDIEALVAYEREQLLTEPRPWSLLGSRLVALDRLDRLAARVHELAKHEATTGDSRPLRRARIDLANTWAHYEKLVADGTPMPNDAELTPPPRRQTPERNGASWHWVYPSPIRQGAAWPHHDDVTIGELREIDPD